MKLKRAEDMARKLGITEDTLLEWRKLGMPWVKIGKTVLIFEDSFYEWARGYENKQNAQDAPGQDFFGKPIGEVRPPKS
ncbi:MAG: hypothetical protein WAU81_05395 [Candidatus Aminicenantales bacterium]